MSLAESPAVTSFAWVKTPDQILAKANRQVT